VRGSAGPASFSAAGCADGLQGARQRQNSGCARARLALEIEIAAVLTGEAPRDRQAEPGAFLIA
jgi:hypothetical protein